MMARPGRTAAVVGAVVAFAAVTLMGMLAGSAAAATPGTCTDNVNVRAEPSMTARILSVCETGTAVTTGAVRNGFVRIENLDGWAAEDYIAVDGASPNSTPRTAPSSPSDDSTTTAPSTTSPRSGDATGSGSTGSGSGDQSGSTARTGDDAGSTGDSTSQNGTSSNSGDDADDADDSGSGLGGGLLG